MPSGLGAGGRGKEKAPCRYLHYEVDWDGSEGEWGRAGAKGKEVAVKKATHKLGIGMGPSGKGTVVRLVFIGLLTTWRSHISYFTPLVASAVDQLRPPSI